MTTDYDTEIPGDIGDEGGSLPILDSPKKKKKYGTMTAKDKHSFKL